MVLSAVPQYLFFEAANDITDVFFVGALLVPPFVFGRVARKLDEQTRLLGSSRRPSSSKPCAPSGTGSPASSTTSSRTR